MTGMWSSFSVDSCKLELLLNSGKIMAFRYDLKVYQANQFFIFSADSVHVTEDRSASPQLPSANVPQALELNTNQDAVIAPPADGIITPEEPSNITSSDAVTINSSGTFSTFAFICMWFVSNMTTLVCQKCKNLQRCKIRCFVILGTPPSTPNTGTPSELPTTSSGNTGTGTTAPSDSQAGTSSDSSERPAGPQNMFGGKLKLFFRQF